MTNKIIIDGIDVSECEYIYTDRYNDLCCDSAICKGFSPCKPSETLCSFYVAQLKTKLNEKVQECKNLKEDYAELEKRHNDSFEQFKNLKMICDDYKMANAELEKENEELKAQLKQVKYLYEVQDEKLIDELATENKKYKQALDKIEKLISEALDPEKTETEQSFDNFYKCLDIIKETKEQ